MSRRREWTIFVVTAVVLAWAVLAFGSVQDLVIKGEVVITEDDVFIGRNVVWPIRTVAGWLTGLGGLVCLFLLPGRGPFPRVPWTLAIAAGFLILYGWLMVANAYSEYSEETRNFTYHQRILDYSWAPGSVARAQSLKLVLELSLVMVALLAVLRACESSAWRGLLTLIALAGGAVALIGMLHKATSAPAVWWIEDDSHPVDSFFAPFVYNANAAAFMNLCLPIAMGLTFSRVGDERGRAAGVFWALVSVVTAASVVVTASKGGIIVAALTVPLMLLWNWRRLRMLVNSFFEQRGRRIERLVQLGALGVLILSLVAIGITYVVQRWSEFVARFGNPAEVDLTRRVEIMKVMARMAGPEEGGWKGFGPGTFGLLQPYYNLEGEQPVRGYWMFGHCDPLQTLVEWGWVGAAAWFVIGAGAVLCGLHLLFRRGWLRSDEVPLVRGAVVGLLMVGLHSCQDFPLSVYSIHLVAMLLCGVCWGLYASRRRSAKEGSGLIAG